MSFLPDWATFLQFVVAVVIVTLLPGPGMLLFLGRAMSQGRFAGIACILGASTGILLQVVAVVVGLSAVIMASPTAFLVLKCAGAGYLFWLALQAVRGGSNFAVQSTAEKKQSFWHNCSAGLSVNLLNPQIVMFNMTFLPQFVDPTAPHAALQLLFLGLCFIVIEIPLNLILVCIAHQFAKVLKTFPMLVLVINWLTAFVFSAFAVRLLLTQI